MKVSDIIAKFLYGKGVKAVFAITGGAIAHTLDSISKIEDITCVFPQHEQACAMAADSYARNTGEIGVAAATSGPGATNLLTGCCCSYYDSVPVLFITGQVATFRLKRDLGIRQLGFQETDIVDIFKPVTKYAVLVDNPTRVLYELGKAMSIAMEGRPGPVLVDIPDDIQRMDIDESKLLVYKEEKTDDQKNANYENIIESIDLINKAIRPVIILGWGIRLSKAEQEVDYFIRKLGFPILPTWAMMDYFEYNDPLLIGSFGLHGTRYGNFSVQNSDLVLVIGSRLDTHLTGSPITSFARGAKKIVIDIDTFELDKYEALGLKVDCAIKGDIKQIINQFLRYEDLIQTCDMAQWMKQINIWKEKYPICPTEYRTHKDVNPYIFMDFLSEVLKDNSTIIADTGCSLAWLMQAFKFKKGQRVFSAFNNTPMGYAVPAGIGAYFANPDREIICITGDGGLQMNIQELSTIVRHKIPIKIFLFNNKGYGMIKQTQDQWFEGRYVASTIESGLGFPDFERVSKAYGFETVTIENASEIPEKLIETIEYDSPTFCNIVIDSKQIVIPQVVFGRPIEDSGPLLEREEFVENMIIKPLEISLKK